MRSGWGSGFWLTVVRGVIVFGSVNIWHLRWQAQLVAWPVALMTVAGLTIWGRSLAEAAAPPVAAASDLITGELPASGRASDRSAAAAVRAAGSITIGDAIRNSARAMRWHPAGDPETDRAALLAGQAFRVTALLRTGGRWGLGRLEISGQPLTVTWKRAPLPLAGPQRVRLKTFPLSLPARILLTRPVDLACDRFPSSNDLIFTVVTIRAQDDQHVLALPSLDVPLVHTALELANAERLQAGPSIGGTGSES